MNDTQSPSFQKALDQLTRYLAQRDHSEKELTEKLKKRFDGEIIQQAITWAKEHRWLKPPQELSERVARQLHEKNKSHQYILQYLKKKGLPPIEKEEPLEIKKAQALLMKKFNKSHSFSYTEAQKAYIFLRTKGFDFTTLQQCTKGSSHEFE